MAPNGSKWQQMAPNGSTWLQIPPNSSKWLKTAPNNYKWLKMAPNGSKWIQLAPNGSNWLQMDTISSKWLQLTPIGSKSLLIALNGSKRLVDGVEFRHCLSCFGNISRFSFFIWWDHLKWLCVSTAVCLWCCSPLEPKPLLRLTVHNAPFWVILLVLLGIWSTVRLRFRKSISWHNLKLLGISTKDVQYHR